MHQWPGRLPWDSGETLRWEPHNDRTSDRHTMSTPGSGPPNAPEQTAAFVEDAGQAVTPANSPAVTLAAVPGNRAIRSVSVWTTEPLDRNGELGYTFHRAHWGQGYATEAVGHLLDLGFGTLGLERITATCHPENTGSIRVLQKSGFRKEGLLRSHRLVNSTRRDSLLFSLLRQDTTEDVPGFS